MHDLTMRPAKPERRKTGPKPKPPHFTPSELRLLDLLPNPDLETVKQIACAMGWSARTCNVMLSRLYPKLGIPGGPIRLATIWAMTHAHVLKGQVVSCPLCLGDLVVEENGVLPVCWCHEDVLRYTQEHVEPAADLPSLTARLDQRD
jgi:hypothetical protein